MKRLPPLPMSPEQRRTLEAWVRAQKTPHSVVVRARIALRAADGLANARIAQELDISRPTVVLWRGRFADGGPSALAGGTSDVTPGLNMPR